MKNRENSKTKYVQLNTALLIGLSCLIIGFIGGMVYSVYGPKEKISSPQAFSTSDKPAQVKISPEQTQKILQLEKDAVSDPENLNTWLQLGNLYFDTENFQRAINAYQKYIEIKPDNPNVWTDLGIMYRRIDQPEQAIETFNRAISIDPLHEQSRYNKGVVFLHDLNDAPAARQEWEELLKINPNFRAPNGRALKDLIDSLKNP